MAPIWLKAVRRSRLELAFQPALEVGDDRCRIVPANRENERKSKPLEVLLVELFAGAQPARRCMTRVRRGVVRRPTPVSVGSWRALARRASGARGSGQLLRRRGVPTAARIESSSCSREANGRVAAARCATHGECSKIPPSAATNSPGGSAFNCSSAITRWAGTGAWRSNGARCRYGGRSRPAGVAVRSRETAPARRSVPVGRSAGNAGRPTASSAHRGRPDRLPDRAYRTPPSDNRRTGCRELNPCAVAKRMSLVSSVYGTTRCATRRALGAATDRRPRSSTADRRRRNPSRTAARRAPPRGAASSGCRGRCTSPAARAEDSRRMAIASAMCARSVASSTCW